MAKIFCTFVFSIFFVVLACACSTHLSVRPASNSNGFEQGHVYYLPRTELTVELERELRNCEVSTSNASLFRLWLQHEHDLMDKGAALKEEASTLLRQRIHESDLSAEFDAEKILADLGEREDGKLQVNVDLKIQFRATLTPHSLPDMTQRYVIDYMTTKSGLKSTNYTVENYPNGTLKSINMSIDDRTSAVAQSTIRGVLTLAGGAAGFPIDLDMPGEDESVPFTNFEKSARSGLRQLCKPEVLGLLRQRQALDRELGTLPAEIAEMQEEVGQLTSALEEERTALEKARSEGKADEEINQYESSVAAAAKDKSHAETALKKKKAEAKPKTARRDRLRDELTVTTTALFMHEVELINQIYLGGADRAAAKWFDMERVEEYCDNNASGGLSMACGAPPSSEDSNSDKRLPKALFAYAAVYLAPSNADYQQPTNACEGEGLNGTADDSCQGVIYRQPATGLMLVCSREECLDGNGKIQALSENLIASEPITIPQLGVSAALPLTNRAFQNNNLQASFTENGALTKVTYSSNARAEAAAGAFEGSANDIAAFLNARREAEEAKRDAATDDLVSEKERVAAQLALEQEIKKLQDFRAGVPVEETPAPDFDEGSEVPTNNGGGNSGDDD